MSVMQGKTNGFGLNGAGHRLPVIKSIFSVLNRERAFPDVPILDAEGLYVRGELTRENNE